MKVCITEKPSVAKDIAEIIGANTKRDGYYEGNGYCVTWTFGHLCTLKEPHDYNDKWRRWTMSSLPMIPQKFGIKLIPQQSIEKQFKVIETLISKAEEVVNCGDAGQEGELIQRWVMQKAGCNKPIKRLWISSLTDDAIREGFNNLKSSHDLDRLYTAGLCRAIGDWILGLNSTRLYTLKYAAQRGQVLSIGRVQTPTLALVVTRQLEIENFIPKSYWELKTKYRGTIFSAIKDGFEKQSKAEELAAKISASPFIVTSVTKKKGREAPPRLFDLTSLQVECNKKFGLGADDTLKTIQSLYEKKVATYPRVDTTYLTDDIYPKCSSILNSLDGYQDLLSPLRGQKLIKSKKVFDNSKVTDHHAIIPTGQRLPILSDIEQKVFDTIALRFISVFYPDCTFEQTIVQGKADNIEFKTTGKVIINDGWKVVYSKTDNQTAKSDISDGNRDESEAILPLFTKGENGVHTPMVQQKTTTPPKYYTEGTLLKAMETAGNQVDDEDLREAMKANGIGRPSTRAAIIETLYKRGYIAKQRKSLRATSAGINLIEIINEELLKSAKLTGIWENRLRLIENGNYSPNQFLDELKEMMRSITISVLSDNSCRKIKISE